MNVDCDLRLQLVREHSKHRLLVHGLLVAPQVVEPLDHAVLKILPHLPEHHVLLYGVHPIKISILRSWASR